MAWTAFWFLIPYSLLLSKGWALLDYRFSLFFKSILCFFRNPAAIFYHTTLLFLPWCYLIYAYWASLGLLLILLLMTQNGHWFYTHATLSFSWPISLLVGSFVSFISSWASLIHLFFLGILGPFSNSTYSWAFTNSLEFPWLNYLILHP